MADDEIPSLLRMFMLSTELQIRALLRPSARRDLRRYIERVSNETQAREWMAWRRQVLDAHREDCRTLRRSRAAEVIWAAPTGMFRRPRIAFRPRWFF